MVGGARAATTSAMGVLILVLASPLAASRLAPASSGDVGGALPEAERPNWVLATRLAHTGDAAAGDASWLADVSAWQAAAFSPPLLGPQPPPAAAMASLASDPAWRAARDGIAAAGLPRHLAGATLAVVDAFEAVHALAQTATSDGWTNPLPILRAREDLARAAVRLGAAAAAHGPLPFRLAHAPLLSVALDDRDDVYTENLLLVVDGGGDDVYRNNAGGTGCGPGGAAWDVLGLRGGGDCCEPSFPAAALLDLAGDDEYGAGTTCQGVGGAGDGGAGFLFDAAGNDSYVTRAAVANGGAFIGTGFLLDGSGDDLYVGGVGWHGAANGAAAEQGLAFLADLGGRDRHQGQGESVNGGGESGIGFLFDAAGDDRYEAAEGAPYANGGCGYPGARGFLLDAAGNDAYAGVDGGVNGGAITCVGFLADLAGDDTYAARHGATNGGASGGVGLLVDLAGDDEYSAGDQAANGGADLGGAGHLIDAEGDDVYVAGSAGTNGGGFGGGVGSLQDWGGDDVYVAGGSGANGGGGLGNLVCLAGGCLLSTVPGGGRLFDAGGRDRYTDAEGGTGVDRTFVPKGVVGAQVDA